MTEQEATKTDEQIEYDLGRIKFYRNKRFVRSLLVSGTIAYLTEDLFCIFFSHAVATVFWDWWFFSFWKVKESSVVPEWYLEWKQISRNEVDQYVAFMVKLRRITLSVSCFVTLFCYIFWSNKIGIDLAFAGTYTITTFIPTLIAEVANWIKFPYSNYSNTVTKCPSSFGENTWVSSSNSSQDSLNMLNPQNTMGYNNLISPNYIGKSMFDN
jgi:F0F1-type ATP synthase membrane subunit a